MGIAQLAAIVVAGVFFIRWFHRAHLNLTNFTDSSTSYNSRWAIWGFFVPFLNLVRPRQLMREVWDTTSRRWEEEPGRVVGLVRPTDRVNLWWGLFLATGFLGNFVGRIYWRATTAQETLHATWLTVFADAFGLSAVMVAIVLVRSVTALQRPFLGDAPVGPGA